MNNFIFDGNGKKMGYWNDTGSTSYAHDVNGKNLGYYNKNNDTTFDKSGKRYGKGNMCTSLIRESYVTSQ